LDTKRVVYVIWAFKSEMHAVILKRILDFNFSFDLGTYIMYVYSAIQTCLATVLAIGERFYLPLSSSKGV